jgi:hypothetical protein
MDYAHAQRVASGLLLRRSRTSHYRQRDGTLSTLRYLHAPLDDFGNPQRAVQVIGPPTIESPVVGVGIGGTEDNQRLVLLCDAGTKDVDFGRLMAAMDLRGFEIERLQTGPVKAPPGQPRVANRWAISEATPGPSDAWCRIRPKTNSC